MFIKRQNTLDLSVMKNWSKHITWSPAQISRPALVDEIQSLIKQASDEGKKIRIIGSGHSFNPLWVTTDILINLDNYQGMISVNKEARQATFKAGTKLHYLNELLFNEGLALENMGDINAQSIAGALSTGTHGTGNNFGTMSTQLVSLKFVNGLGELVSCSITEHSDLFKAAQLSLGALGIIVEVTLQCVEAFVLKMQIDKADINEVLQNYQSVNHNIRNYEFYWFPHTKFAMTKKVSLTKDAPDKNGFSKFIQDVLLENLGYLLLNNIAYIHPGSTKAISRFSTKTLGSMTKVDFGHKIFVTPRWVRFNEMEYNIRLEKFENVVDEIQKEINDNFPNILFPLEHRFVKQDDIYLSPAYQRESAYIACHVYYKKSFVKYFRSMEQIFLKYDGRPHWGKMHNLTSSHFNNQYPQFSTFQNFAIAQDPNRIFVNEYLNRILYEG